MISKELLKKILLRQKEQFCAKKGTVERDLLKDIVKWFNDERIMIISGIRRVGKSTLLSQIMGQKKGCYVNFEDEKLLNFKAKDFEFLNEALAEVYGTSKVYFFDEVQNVGQFESFIRRLHDQKKKIVITGSNALLLSGELGTKLTGRYKLFELFPFSFVEFLRFKSAENASIKRKQQLFKEFFTMGGMPEYLKNNDPDYIRTVYENILYRDLIARYSIRRQRVVKELVNMLATNVSSKFTYNALKKSLGLANSITVKEHICHLSDAYLFFELEKFDFSSRRRIAAPKKIYFVDHSFCQVLGTEFSANSGKILENIVFIELKRRRKELYYFSGENECDFVVKKGAGVQEAIQVCYELNDGNMEREVVGLLEAMQALKIKKGIVLTYNQKDDIIKDGKRVKVMPVWEWMLED
ncbi:MAG: ATP-binding protein [Candidatus Woesearchaeota archaeon]